MDLAYSLPLYHEEWILDKTQKSGWEEFLATQNITLDYFVQTLANYRLASISFDQPDELSFRPPSLVSTAHPEMFFNDLNVEVLSPPSPRVRNHLWVVLKRPVSSFSEVTTDEAAHMRSTVHKILSILRSDFNLPAVVAQWMQPQPGQLDGKFTIEVIPARSDSRGAANLWDKVECNSYVLFRGLFPPSLLPPTLEETAQDVAFWKTALQRDYRFPTDTKSDPIENWSVKQTKLDKAAARILDSVEQLLRMNGLSIERKSTRRRIPDLEFTHRQQGCPFCTEKVIQSQMVIETDLSRVLYNFKPATLGAHFLMMPKRHLRTMECLREDEVRDLHALALKLSKALQKKYGRSDIAMYTQDGPEVGQTVAHTHMHLMLTPKPLRHLLFSLNYQKEKPLSTEEMQEVVQEIRELLALISHTHG